MQNSMSVIVARGPQKSSNIKEIPQVAESQHFVPIVELKFANALEREVFECLASVIPFDDDTAQRVLANEDFGFLGVDSFGVILLRSKLKQFLQVDLEVSEMYPKK